MIDRTKPLTEQTSGDLRALLDALHGNRASYELANRIVEARSCELEISEATRALAIINRRATEALDQQQAGGVTQHEVDAALALLRHVEADEAHALVARMWTAMQQHGQPALTSDEMRAVVRDAVLHHSVDQHMGRFIERGHQIDALDAIADRVADKLAGRVVTDNRSDLEYLAGWCNASIGDVVVDRPRFERGVAALDRLLAMELRPSPEQREQDLREAYRAGAGMVGMVAAANLGDKPALLAAFPSMDECDEAAAEYARCKAGT